MVFSVIAKMLSKSPKLNQLGIIIDNKITWEIHIKKLHVEIRKSKRPLISKDYKYAI